MLIKHTIWSVSIKLSILTLLLAPAYSLASTTTVYAGKQCGKKVESRGIEPVKTKIDLACKGDALSDKFANPIYDLLFALVRLLTAGVGVVIIGAIVWAGIRYSAAEGNPDATMKAKSDIQSAMVALLIYIFAFALINFLVPGGLLT